MARRSQRHSQDERARINLAEVIDALREERAAIDRLIEAVELMAANQPKRKAGSSNWLREVKRRRKATNVIVFATRDIA